MPGLPRNAVSFKLRGEQAKQNGALLPSWKQRVKLCGAGLLVGGQVFLPTCIDLEVSRMAGVLFLAPAPPQALSVSPSSYGYLKLNLN